ncbi:hypothetical protein KQJ25_06230, partial [Escherichia sp. S69_ASV_4]|nr:hypothetical protein [Escherichia sp. S69_ASV_4]
DVYKRQIPHAHSCRRREKNNPIMVDLPLYPETLRPEVFADCDIHKTESDTYRLFTSVQLPPATDIPR